MQGGRHSGSRAGSCQGRQRSAHLQCFNYRHLVAARLYHTQICRLPFKCVCLHFEAQKGHPLPCLKDLQPLIGAYWAGNVPEGGEEAAAEAKPAAEEPQQKEEPKGKPKPQPKKAEPAAKPAPEKKPEKKPEPPKQPSPAPSVRQELALNLKASI